MLNPGLAVRSRAYSSQCHIDLDQPLCSWSNVWSRGAQTPVAVKLKPWWHCSGSHRPSPKRSHLEQWSAHGPHSCTIRLPFPSLPTDLKVVPSAHSWQKSRAGQYLHPRTKQGKQSPSSSKPKVAGQPRQGSLAGSVTLVGASDITCKSAWDLESSRSSSQLQRGLKQGMQKPCEKP